MAALGVSAALVAATPPVTPILLEPATDGQIVNGADVHMVTTPFVDPDDDEHLCSDWEILDDDEATVWRATCASGAERIHIHLGDGLFVGTHSGNRELLPGHSYDLRVRHRDDSGDESTEWSDWGLRTFVTSPPAESLPMMLKDIRTPPLPVWQSVAGTIDPPAGALLRVEAADAAPLLEIRNGLLEDRPPLTSRTAIRLFLETMNDVWLIPVSSLSFDDEKGRRQTIYLPSLVLHQGESIVLWVSANGGTHYGAAEDRAPDFGHVAYGSPAPWTAEQRGFVVEPVVGDLQLPLNLAFVPDPGETPESPLFYVSELYGAVKVVTRGGTVHDFATGLLDFDPTGHVPGSGESGLAGLTYDDESGDLFATVVYWPDRDIRELYPKVIRLRAAEGGLSAASVETIVAFPGERQSASHQISNITIGPDRMLYVHVGDSAIASHAHDMTTIRGKILRMNFDGSPAEDNPWYDASDGISAADYIHAIGFRNPFGGAWRAADQSLYIVENGPTTDRLVKLVRGEDYGWDGTDESMHTHAITTWTAPSAPVQIAFVQRDTFGGSGFPPEKSGAAYVTESGPTWSNGPQPVGKSVSEVILGSDGQLIQSSTPLIAYNGTGRATVAGIAAGPDGLYFTTLYKDFDYQSPIDRGAEIFRIRWAGYADFAVRSVTIDGLTIDLVNRSNVPGDPTFEWDFGDGTGSVEKHPRKRYEAEGTYIVRLRVTGPSGTVVETKEILVAAQTAVLNGIYYSTPEFGGLEVGRTDHALGFDWGLERPFDAIPQSAFSVRWSGPLVPRFSETYRFALQTTGQARVWLDEHLLIDLPHSHDHAAPAAFDLEAGREYQLLVEYRHDDGPASIRLTWESGSQPSLVVPQSEIRTKARATRGGS